MYPLADLAQYKALAGAARKAGWRHSNCYLLPDAVRQKTADGRLFAQPLDRGLLFLEADPRGFYRVYYYLAPDFAGAELALDKDAVVEFPFLAPLESDTVKRVEPALLARLGFTLGRRSTCLAGTPDTLAMGPCPLPAGYALGPAGPDLAPAVLALFDACFDPLYAFLPTLAAMQALTAQGSILAVCRGGELAGAIHSSLQGRQAVCEQVAVAPGHRGLGLGKALVAAHHRRCRGTARQYLVWTDEANTGAIRMYQGLGYSTTPPHARKANEYIKLKSNATAGVTASA